MREEGYKFQGSGFRVNGFLAKRGFSLCAKQDAPQHSSNKFGSAFGFHCFSF